MACLDDPLELTEELEDEGDDDEATGMEMGEGNALKFICGYIMYAYGLYVASGMNCWPC